MRTMAKKKNAAVKAAVWILTAAVFAAGGYYAGYTQHALNISAAIPKQALKEHTEATEPPEFPAAAATEPPKASEQPEENADAGKYIGKSTSSAVEATWSKIDSYECDINSDGAEETISLYTSAETDSGEILWDDSQKWVLEVRAGKDYYILLNQNISNGRVYFDIDELKDGTYGITVYTVSGVGTAIKQYTYSKTGFVEKAVYTAASENKLHSGIPSYK